ncbi:hypothetical protein PsYK624_083900 [Phanerochaete sordida]|uniref:Uncharacterized protein n=1 Tax=Phanerochaete sordida TaxID=48140 RepID=A0A9P3GCR3_9APHY|nr:hypothetical protein PsYK624_083900 [Phanerochaete sordida]
MVNEAATRSFTPNEERPDSTSKADLQRAIEWAASSGVTERSRSAAELSTAQSQTPPHPAERTALAYPSEAELMHHLQGLATETPGSDAVAASPRERQIMHLQELLDQLREAERASTSSDPTMLALMQEVASLRAEIAEIRGQDRDTETPPGYYTISSRG